MVKSKEKSNGIYYTPPELANFIASISIDSPDAIILDPAYGQCALLIAARERLKNLGATDPNSQLFGFDIQPLNDDKKSLYGGLFEENNLIKKDFFTSSVESRYQSFDAVLMNPPFVRHHNINKKQLDNIRLITFSQDIGLPKTSDLWAYFVINSLKFIKEKGSLAAILPWSFIQANYSKIVRQKLIDRFEIINVIIIGKHMFNEAQERILVLFCENYGSTTKKINIFYSYDMPNGKIKYDQITKNNWINTPIYQFETINKILKKVVDKAKFTSLGNYSTIKIGTVTGANSFFIVDKNTINDFKIPKYLLRPIIKNANELKSLSVDKNTIFPNYLLTIDTNLELTKSLIDYIKIGKTKGLHLGYHTKKRNHWYIIENPTSPDAFMPYMSKEIPYITLNNGEILSTNSIHQIFFNENVNNNTKKWIQFSIFSSISQLSIELNGKTYGGGVLKIEPSAAKKILIYPGSEQEIPDKLIKKINTLVANGDKKKAMDFVDKWVIDNLGIPNKDVEMIKNYYNMIRDMRLNQI